jgi:hypothetical protein
MGKWSGRPHESGAAARADHRALMPDRMLQQVENPPLPALGGLFIAISKRDPAPSFNRDFHIDAYQLTSSYRCPWIEQLRS